jgi:hypothetical protein
MLAHEWFIAGFSFFLGGLIALGVAVFVVGTCQGLKQGLENTRKKQSSRKASPRIEELR